MRVFKVEPDQFYTASVVLDGPELSYFGQEGMTEVQAGAVNFQFQCSADSTNGTGVQGGQIPELLFYGPSPAQAAVSVTAGQVAAPLASPSPLQSPATGQAAAAAGGDRPSSAAGVSTPLPSDQQL